MAKPNAQDDGKKEGQGFNDARGEVPDKKDTPRNNGQNVNNDPAHLAERQRRQQQSQETQRASQPTKEAKDQENYQKIEKDLLRTAKNK